MNDLNMRDSGMKYWTFFNFSKLNFQARPLPVSAKEIYRVWGVTMSGWGSFLILKWRDIPCNACRISKFALGGGIGTLCHYVLLWVMVNLGFNPLAASGCGMVLGAAVVYLTNYYLTFSSSRKHYDALKRFLPMASIGFCLNVLIMGWALEFCSLPLWLSQVMATSGQFLFGYSASGLWVF